jgi:hypothetical protein
MELKFYIKKQEDVSTIVMEHLNNILFHKQHTYQSIEHVKSRHRWYRDNVLAGTKRAEADGFLP